MLTVRQIIERFPGTELKGDSSTSIREVIQLDPSNLKSDVLFWCSDKNLDRLSLCKSGTVICSEKAKAIVASENCNYLFTANPRQLFGQVLKEFFVSKPAADYISPKASIHPSVKIGKHVSIGDFTVIEQGCVIGDHSVIGHNNILHEKTIIGNHVKIGSNNTIGGVGFGYEKDEQGNYEVLPHIGNVVIKDKVEIGNNTCIDRAVLGSTLIGENVKIDNLVHVAHGVTIGENTLVIAHAMLGGSCVIGKNCWIAPHASIINKGIVEDGALVGMGAVVLKPVKAGTVVAGNPAKYLKDL